jgi:hypothetical protein
MSGYASRDKQNLSDIAIIDAAAIAQLTEGLNIPGAVSDYLTANPPAGGLTIDQIKADTSIADAITKKHASGSDNQDLSNLVVKVTGSSLVPDTEIAKIHTAGSDNQTRADLGLDTTDGPTFADIVITGLSGNIIPSESIEAAIEALDDAVYNMADTGFGAWTSGVDATTYTITGGKFQLDRAGYGFIRGKRVTWAASQQTGVLAANTFYSVYIDAAGLIQTSTSPFTADVVRLYEVLYDGTIYFIAKENHAIPFDNSVSGYLHNNAGTTIRSTGAIITRVATGTGASVDDRRVKIVGADNLDDHGLSTAIPELNPVVWNIFYRNGSGKWIRYAQQSNLPIFYNSAGTPTALDAVNIYGEYVLYVAKDDIETSAPQYIAVMGESSQITLAALLAVISSGTSIFATNELKNIEAAQLGYAVVQYSATGGYIEELQVVKSTFNSQLVGGSAGSDHGLLSGLGDDDHTQYHNDARGDVRYEPKKGTDDNFVTDAEKVIIGNTSGTNSGNNAANSLYSGLAASKQDTLVSATNIKTINGASVLGAGDLTVSGAMPHLVGSIISQTTDESIATNIGVIIPITYKITGTSVLTIAGTGLMQIR